MKVLQILILIAGLIVLANAQNITLAGIVYDENGARIPGTKIKLVSKSGKEYKTETRNDGDYEITLPLGLYRIDFTSTGFKKLTVKNYRIINSDSKKMCFDTVMEPGKLVIDID